MQHIYLGIDMIWTDISFPSMHDGWMDRVSNHLCFEPDRDFGILDMAECMIEGPPDLFTHPSQAKSD